MSLRNHDLASHVAAIGPALPGTLLSITPGLYAGPATRFASFRGHLLIARHDVEADCPSGEVDPAGAGEVLRQAPGQFIAVPVGTWHTARFAGPTRMLLITAGDGTQNRETPP